MKQQKHLEDLDFDGSYGHVFEDNFGGFHKTMRTKPKTGKKRYDKPSSDRRKAPRLWSDLIA